jgi:hypothetical protein
MNKQLHSTGHDAVQRIDVKLPLSSYIQTHKKTPWPQFANELYRPSDRRLSAKLVPTFADRGCNVVSMTDSHGRILDLLDRSTYKLQA